MAKEQKQESAPTPEVPEAPEALGPPKSYRLHIVIGFSGLILFQLITIFMLMPGKPQPEWRGGIDITNGPRIFEGVKDMPEIISQEEMTSIPIREGRMSVKSPDESFSLVMNVMVRKKDERKFNSRFAECQNEVIDRVSAVLMDSTTAERGEPGHTTIRAKSKEAINKVLRFPYVQQVLVQDPSHEVN